MDAHIRYRGFMVLLSFVVGMPVASACTGAPFLDAWNWGGSSAWEDDAGGCSFRAEVTAIDAPAMVSASYLRRTPVAPLRLRFILDAPDLPALNSLQGASLARGVVRRVDAPLLPAAPVFDLFLFGNLSSSNYHLGVQAWCSGGVGSSCSSVTLPFGADDFPVEVELDVEVGAGASGRVRLWVNSDPDTTAPTVQLSDLDNMATGGIDRVAVGLFNTTSAFNQAVAGRPIVFRNLQTSDEQLFWSDFESLLPGNVEANRPELVSWINYSGTICGGTEFLPQVAFGTASLYGPVAIHPVSLASSTASFALASFGDFPLMMFLCRAGAGPSGACFAAGRSNGFFLTTSDVPPGQYQLIVGASRRDSSCAPYVISMTGPLGR